MLTKNNDIDIQMTEVHIDLMRLITPFSQEYVSVWSRTAIFGNDVIIIIVKSPCYLSITKCYYDIFQFRTI